MSRYDYNRDTRWVGAFVLIAVGVIGLLVNFGFLAREIVDQLWKLWPLIPLALGFRVLLRRERARRDDPPRV